MKMRIATVKFSFQFFACLLLSLSQVLAATVPPSRKTAPNVVLITIDTVRADHLGCYGAKDIQTPTLDALAHDGIVFERAISQVPLTWPSHAAILTGLYPFQNGVQDFTDQPLEPRFRSVAQSFQRHGYATGAVVSSFVLDRSWGLARGFDFYDDAFPAAAFANKDLGLVERPAGESVTRALGWLQKNPRRPFFFWLHLYDPHSPYDPPEPYLTQPVDDRAFRLRAHRLRIHNLPAIHRRDNAVNLELAALHRHLGHFGKVAAKRTEGRNAASPALRQRLTPARLLRR